MRFASSFLTMELRIRIEVGEVVEVPDELEESGIFADDVEAGLIQIEKTEKKPVSRRGEKKPQRRKSRKAPV